MSSDVCGQAFVKKKIMDQKWKIKNTFNDFSFKKDFRKCVFIKLLKKLNSFFKIDIFTFEGFLTVKMFNQSINGQLSQL